MFFTPSPKQVVHNNVHPHTNGGGSHTCDLLNAPNGIFYGDEEDKEDADDDGCAGDDDDDDDDNNKSEITAIQLTVENVEPRLRSVLHKVSSTIDRWSVRLFSTQNQPKSCF